MRLSFYPLPNTLKCSICKKQIKDKRTYYSLMVCGHESAFCSKHCIGVNYLKCHPGILKIKKIEG